MKNADLPAMPPNAGWEHPEAKGLTKREYFAGLALQGVLAASTTEAGMSMLNRAIESDDLTSAEAVASAATQYADELLAELEK